MILFQEFSSSEFQCNGRALPCWRLAVENFGLGPFRSWVCMSVSCPLSQWLARLDVIFDEYDTVWRYLQGCISFLVCIYLLVYGWVMFDDAVCDFIIVM